MATATAKAGKGSKSAAKAGKAKAKTATREQLATPADREAAAKCELNPVNYRVLKALEKTGPKNGMTYRQIEAKTGYYSILTAVCRAVSGRDGKHDASLGGMGLIKEEKLPKEGSDSLGPITFYITAEGKKRLAKAAK